MTNARDMSPTERETWLREHARKSREAAPAELKRGQLPDPPAPSDGQKRARDMTPAEQAAFLKDHARKFR
jgi:hypothetical protein